MHNSIGAPIPVSALAVQHGILLPENLQTCTKWGSHATHTHTHTLCQTQEYSMGTSACLMRLQQIMPDVVPEGIGPQYAGLQFCQLHQRPELPPSGQPAPNNTQT